jgi:hypothetical protein
MWEVQEQRLNTWAEMQAMSRLCGSVAKVHKKILQMGGLSKLSSMQISLCYSPTNSPSLFFVPLNHVSLTILSFLTMTILLRVR